jgi:hypothetical protein
MVGGAILAACARRASTGPRWRRDKGGAIRKWCAFPVEIAVFASGAGRRAAGKVFAAGIGAGRRGDRPSPSTGLNEHEGRNAVVPAGA